MIRRSAVPMAVGIDLAASPEYGAKRYGRVGLAALDARLSVRELSAGPFTDDTIVDFVERHRPTVVAIDAPLSLPAEGILRPVDRELTRRKLHPYPPLLPSMAAMTRRGCALRAMLSGRGCDVIEVFPGAAQDVLGIPRKKAGLNELAAGLRRLGMAGLPAKPDGDALDAVTAAYVAQLYRRGRCEAIGPDDDVQVWVPMAIAAAR
jgi:predicted nuclease with RNAse H fold